MNPQSSGLTARSVAHTPTIEIIMRILVATDSFGGTLTAVEACDAIARGWSDSRPQDSIDVLPLSDGGEGLINALQRPNPEHRKSSVTDAMGRPVTVDWLLDAAGTAVIETATACGLRDLAPWDVDPVHATTQGVGELLLAAENGGAKRIIVGLGGSGTVDGGLGALSRLGFGLLDRDGQQLDARVESLLQLSEIAVPETPHLNATVEVWADVHTTLVESVHMFGPQKGLAPERIDFVERALHQWAVCLEAALGGQWRSVRGSGAAGGLGFAMAAIGGTLMAGASAFADRVDLGSRIANADLVVTGEGRLDQTSLEGKILARVVMDASDIGVPVFAVVGSNTLRPAPAGLEGIVEASPGGPGLRPDRDVERAAARLATSFGALEAKGH